MSIEKLNQHYSMQNLPTVYDEEALTALEMIGRLGAKMNEVITYVNKIDPSIPTPGPIEPEPEEDKDTFQIAPSGDESGEADLLAIQEKLDEGYTVHLAAGEYYINSPIMVGPGYMIKGDGQLKTVIHCSAGFIGHYDNTSADHVQVQNVRVMGPGSGIGIDISRKNEGKETGGRYARFENVYISEYGTGVLMAGCWCVNFTHCRIEATEICAEQRGGCNHIKYDHCIFLGPVDTKTTTAIKISADGGAENCGINIDHCDFERHKYGIYAYCCVSLNVTAVYAESIDTMFHLDSCPGFQCSGGYVSYPRIVLQGFRTNTLPLYDKSCGALRDIFVKVNSAEKWPLMSTPDDYPVITENITVHNDGGGKCYGNAQYYTSRYNGNKDAFHIKYSKTGVPLHTPVSVYDTLQLASGDKQFKIVSGKLIIYEAFTQTGTPGLITFGTDSDKNGPSLKFVIPVGSYEAGHAFDAALGDGVGTDYSNLIYEDGFWSCDLTIVNAITKTNITANVFIDVYMKDYVL